MRLGRVLDFFGVPCQLVALTGLDPVSKGWSDCAVFGSAHLVASALNQNGAKVSQPEACFAYPSEISDPSRSGVRTLFGDVGVELRRSTANTTSLHVSQEIPALVGPMGGLDVSVRLRSEDGLLEGYVDREDALCSVISAGNASVFVRSIHRGVPVFFSGCSEIVDLDQPVTRGFCDVRDHFCSAVPLVMFIRFLFSEVAWRAQEVGGCLIIDDPLLKPRYGFCNFPQMRDLMRRYGFTTNIAFIPWNWRRTSKESSDLFRNDPNFFSVSIHGCDHTSGEFGATSVDALRAAAHTAKERMHGHRRRTGVEHDPVMVFPQGVFSSACPGVLQRANFLAAVNTEVNPSDLQNSRTRIRDVWDIAIMSYDGFPIFTRRYASHGLANFAFDLLLGKPCLIVAHHDFFKDGGLELIDLVTSIESLGCAVQWRSLGAVLRRACRRRLVRPGFEEVEMYGNELLLKNDTGQRIQVTVRKRKSPGDCIAEILCDQTKVRWKNASEHDFFDVAIPPHTEILIRVVYREDASREIHRSLRFRASVALRRIFSELRDEYLLTNRFLNAPTRRLKTALRKAI